MQDASHSFTDYDARNIRICFAVSGALGFIGSGASLLYIVLISISYLNVWF
jgi:hypothetical protein